MNPSRSKPRLRDEARLRRREAFRVFGSRIGSILTANFLARLSPSPDCAIAGYWPVHDEADCLPLLKALAGRGHDLGLPRVVALDRPLEFRRWQPGDALETGPHGIPQPGSSEPLVMPRLLLVPLLAFDASGQRLGYGAGLYDRTLSALRADAMIEAVGVAFAAQETESLPVSSHDQPLDWILTERDCHRLKPLKPLNQGILSAERSGRQDPEVPDQAEQGSDSRQGSGQGSAQGEGKEPA